MITQRPDGGAESSGCERPRRSHGVVRARALRGMMSLILGAALVLATILVGCAARPNSTVTQPVAHVVMPEAAATPSPLITRASRSAGCGHAAPLPPGASASRLLTVGLLVRTYRLHLPRGYRSSHPQPLVLLFHGHGALAAGFERYTGFSRLADTQDFIAVYPQGMVGPDDFTGWNTYRAKDPSVNDLAFMRALVPHLEAELCVDPQRVYAAGFSNGGGFVGVLACAMAHTFAAVAVVSGDFYLRQPACAPARPISIIEIHGTDDFVNPYDGSVALDYAPVARWIVAWAARDGCAALPTQTVALPRVTEAWAHCRAGTLVEHIRLVGGKHVWPGTERGLRTPVADRAFGATSAIWSFFAPRTLSAH